MATSTPSAIKLINSEAAITATTGVLTLTTDVYMGSAGAAAFSAITGTPATVTCTVSGGKVHCVVVITPDTAVDVNASSSAQFKGDYSNAGAGTVG